MTLKQFLSIVVSLFLASAPLIAQVDTVSAKVKFKDGNVIEYLALDKPYGASLSLIVNNKVKRLNLKKVETFTLGETDYIIWNPPGIIKARASKIIDSGAIELFKFKETYLISVADFDYIESINLRSPKRTLKPYLDDYPDFYNREIPKDSIADIVSLYNDRKTEGNTSSTMESRLNEYKQFTFKVMYILPSAGYELGISKRFTFSQFAGLTGIGLINGSFVLEYGAHSTFRFYHDINRKERLQKPTQWRSSRYIAAGSLVNIDLNNNIRNYAFVDYGWQNIFRHNYADYAIGVGYDPFNQIGMIRLLLFGGFAF